MSGDPDIVVIGSQAILGSFPNAPLPMLVSVEADVFPLNDRANADDIDGALGELSRFHETHRVYAHLVAEDAAKAPAGWQERLVKLHNENTADATGWCMEPHDLVLAKLARGDEKDRDFAVTALAFGLVEAAELQERLPSMLIDEAHKTMVASALRSSITRAVQLPAPGGSHTIPLLQSASSGRTWVSAHERAGHPVRGYWRGNA